MLRDILTDFCSGFVTSIRLDYFFNHIIAKGGLIRHIWKIIKFNIAAHLIIPFILQYLPFFDFFYGIVKIGSIIFHGIYYFDLLTQIPINKKIKSGSAIDTIATIVTLIIYQFSIELVLVFCNYFLSPFTILLTIINYVIPVIYHSFYFFNNYWQRINMDINKRIDIFESNWPYYFGYGTIAALLYNQTYFLYNLYLIIGIVIPFAIPDRKVDTIYPRINLSIFTYISEWMFYLISLKFKPVNAH